MLAALGFKRVTRIYLAGAHMYGGEAKMALLKYLYPNIVTKEDILTEEEIAPFRHFSSQVHNLKPGIDMRSPFLAPTWLNFLHCPLMTSFYLILCS